MAGWNILISCAVCALGGLLFLKLVADEIEAVTGKLRRLEECGRQAYRKRHSGESDVPLTAHAAAA